MELTREDALALAENILTSEVRPGVGEEVVVLPDQTVETPRLWVFFYNTRAFVETGSIAHALAGNSPILIDKSTGRASLGRTDTPWEDQVV
jgi:hypothetical protein